LYSGLLPTAPAPLLTTEIDHHHRDIISSLDVEDIRAEIEEERSKRDRASELGRSLSAVFSNYISSIHYAAVTPMIIEAHETAKDKLIQHLTEWPQPPGCREWGLQSAIEQFLIAEGFAHFLKTGKTLSRHQIGADLLHDEEYMAGVMGMCQELSHYSMRRATELDQSSVRLCSKFIHEVKEELLNFNFRNSPLRRRFDGIKYAERRCENILYELSFAPGLATQQYDKAKEESYQPAKSRIQHLSSPSSSSLSSPLSSSVLSSREWEDLRVAYEANDERRELVIKGCRDVQKAAKQAVYAAHRGNISQARDLIEKANVDIKRLQQDLIADAPSLRYGSFSGALEELAEAELFLQWLEEDDGNDDDDKDEEERRRRESEDNNKRPLLPRRQELASGLLDYSGYLGALSDFTGEVGRVAVEKAIRRDTKMVRKCLHSVFASYTLLASLPLQGKNNMRKVDAAKNNFRKLEAIEYDLAVRSFDSDRRSGDGGENQQQQHRTSMMMRIDQERTNNGRRQQQGDDESDDSYVVDDDRR